MSYAIAPTFEANKIGVRRVYTLAGLGSAVSDGMLSEGYNANIMMQLVGAGATDAQLQNLWDNYGAGTPEFGRAATQLVASLSPSGSFIDTSLPQSVVSVINSTFGAFDLARKDSWNAIAGILTDTRNNINNVARLAPKDPDVIQHVTDFNSVIGKFANAYDQLFHEAPPSIPFASIPTLSGLGQDPGSLAIVAGVMIFVLGVAYEYNQWAANKTALVQAQGGLVQAQNQAAAVKAAQDTAKTLLDQAAAELAAANALPPEKSAQAAAMRADAALKQQQATGLVGQSLSTTMPGVAAAPLTNWFTQNWMYVAAVLVGMAVLPPLIKKL